MDYEWDELKRTANIVKHGVDFNDVLEFQWDTAIETEDTRQEYEEPRWISLGKIRGRLYVLVYTIRSDNIRLISLRKANGREIQHYEKTQKLI